MKKTPEIMTYRSPDGDSLVEVALDQETVWLSQQQMGFLFGRDYKTISKHIINVFKEGELDKDSVVANFATTAQDGKTYQVEYYNLDVIISVGYRVKSQRGTNFRIWATHVLRNHLLEKAKREAFSSSNEDKYRFSDLRRSGIVPRHRRKSSQSALLHHQKSFLFRRQQTHCSRFIRLFPRQKPETLPV